VALEARLGRVGTNRTLGPSVDLEGFEPASCRVALGVLLHDPDDYPGALGNGVVRALRLEQIEHNGGTVLEVAARVTLEGGFVRIERMYPAGRFVERVPRADRRDRHVVPVSRYPRG
jgi:hypothetical protein